MPAQSLRTLAARRPVAPAGPIGKTYGSGCLLSENCAILAVSTGGTNGAMAQQHSAVRSMLRWPDGAMRPRPVHLNSWEACYFDHDEERIVALAEAAAEIGVERFILDDGWFRGRNNDDAGLGDWTADPVKYPHGLKPLAERVCALGMEFGLWVEPEMVNPDSELAEKTCDDYMSEGPLAALDAIRDRLELVEWLHDDALLRGDLRTVLRGLPDIGRALGRVVAGRVTWAGPPSSASRRHRRLRSAAPQ